MLEILRDVRRKLSAQSDESRHCRTIFMRVPKSEPIDIDFDNISYSVKAKPENKAILKGVSGKFKSGELTAIMGPSGAGKSSLLHILTGFRTSDASGTVRNRELGNRNDKKESCYILQDDLLNPLFTVQEIMTIAAGLKLGGISSASKQTLIDDALETLGLLNSKATRCGHLSGGQKKRLSIALELLDNPPVMFLDEPTTGLDSSASLQCITKLKELARGGRTVICSIHQPSATIFETFDHVYVLAEGMCIYQGASVNTVDYLKSAGFECPKYHNPADYMLEIANCEYGNHNNRLAKLSSDPSWRVNSIITETGDEYLPPNLSKATILITPPGELGRLWILFKRCLVQQYRDWTVTHLKALLHCIVAVIIGLNFANCGSDGTKAISNLGYLVLTLVYMTHTTMMPALLRFPQELHILKKENFNNWYQLKTYYAAVILCNTPIQMFLATLFCGISYFLSSQPLELWRFLMFLGIQIVVTLIAEAIGHIIGSVLDKVNGTFCGAILTCAHLAFAGFLVQIPHMSAPMRFISYLSYFRYSLEALAQSVYGYNRTLLDCPPHQFYCHLRYPSKILRDVSMDGERYWTNVIVLCSCLIATKIVAYIALHRKVRKS